jgi:integrase
MSTTAIAGTETATRLELLPVRRGGTKTHSVYNDHIKLFNAWNGGRAVTSERVAEYLQGLRGSLRAATIKVKKAAIKKSLKRTYRSESQNAAWLAALDAAFREIRTPRPAGKVSQKDILDRDEVQALIGGAPERIGLMVRFLYNTGLRVSEMTGIRLADCSRPVRGRVHVRVTGKGGKERDVDLSAELHGEIRRVFGARRKAERLFRNTRSASGGYSRQYVWREINRHSNRVLSRPFRTHGLRHSHATALLDAGCGVDAVADRLGHSDKATTARYYLHTRVKRDALEKVEV